MPQFPDDAHGALHELFVGGQLALSVVDVVLEADPNVAAEDDRVGGRRKLGWADRGDVKMQFSGSASTIICRIFAV